MSGRCVHVLPDSLSLFSFKREGNGDISSSPTAPPPPPPLPLHYLVSLRPCALLSTSPSPPPSSDHSSSPPYQHRAREAIRSTFARDVLLHLRPKWVFRIPNVRIRSLVWYRSDCLLVRYFLPSLSPRQKMIDLDTTLRQ